MSVVNCPRCQKKMRLPDNSQGKSFICPHCRELVPAPPQSTVHRELLTHPETVRPASANSGVPSSLTDFLAPAQSSDEIGRLGTYRVLEVLGSGGMGVVFRAQDPHLRRVIALKAMLPALAASTSARERFVREARATAAIKHDHIVTIHQVSEDRGIPYLAMEYLEGESLDDCLKREGKLRPAAVVHIGRQIAEGLAAAHSRGLVHRDIKPANVWLETRSTFRKKEGEKGRKGEGESEIQNAGGLPFSPSPILPFSPATQCRVKILDFGLARSSGDGVGITQPGAVLGTPAYMAPEQAAAEAVDYRSDLFSLGCVLYRMMTGRLPFDGKDPLSMMKSVATDPPRPPRDSDSSLPPALCDLVMQLLAKDQKDRPQSAQAVADALHAIEDQAQPGGQSDTSHFTPPIRSRSPAVASSTPRATTSRTRARILIVASIVAVVLTGAGVAAVWIGSSIFSSRSTSDGNSSSSLASQSASSNGSEDASSDDEGTPVLTVQSGHGTLITCLTFDQSGRWLATGSADNTARLWEVASGREIRAFAAHEAGLVGVAFTPDARRLVTASQDMTARLWDTTTGRELHVYKTKEPIVAMALSRDGKLLVLGCSDTVSFWNVETAKEIRGNLKLEDSIQSIALGHGDKWLLTAGQEAKIFDVDTGNLLKTLETLEPMPVSKVALTSDGKWAVTVSADNKIHLWDTSNVRPVREFKGITFSIDSLALSDDDKWLVASSNINGEPSILWEVTTGKQAGILRDKDEIPPSALAVSADGKFVAQGCFDGVCRLWDIDAGRETTKFEGHLVPAIMAAPSGDAKRLVTGSIDGNVVVWDTQLGKPSHRFATGSIQVATVTADGKLLITAGAELSARSWNLPNGGAGPEFRGHTGVITTLAASRDGRWLVTGSVDRSARLWELTTGKSVRTFVEPNSLFTSVACSDDGHLVATGSQLGTVLLWDPDKDKSIRALKGHTTAVVAIAFTGDGKNVITGSSDQTVRLWDVGNGNEVRTWHNVNVQCLTQNRDGTLLVVGVVDGILRAFETATGNEVRQFKGATPGVRSVALVGDGKWLVSLGDDGITHFWDFASGKELCRVLNLRNDAWAILTPDGYFEVSNPDKVEALYWVVGRRSYDFRGRPTASGAEPHGVVGRKSIDVRALLAKYQEQKLLSKRLGW